MALFPKIQSPCPYTDRFATIMDGDMCRMCKRQVFDLTDMSDGERVAFMKGCGGEVCVSYKVRVRPALAAAALAALAIAAPTAAAAQIEDVVVTAGGIKDTAHVEYVKAADDRGAPELPVVYENKAPDPVAKNTSLPPPTRHPAR